MVPPHARTARDIRATQEGFEARALVAVSRSAALLGPALAGWLRGLKAAQSLMLKVTQITQSWRETLSSVSGDADTPGDVPWKVPVSIAQIV